MQLPPIEPMTQGSDDGGILGLICIGSVILFVVVLIAKMANGVADSDDRDSEEP